MAQQTLLALRQRLRHRLDDQAGRGWSDPELNGYISEGARDVTRKAETNMTSSTVSVSAETSVVNTLPTNVLRIYRAEWHTTDSRRIALEYRDMNNMDAVWWDHQNTVSSVPAFYTTRGYPPSLQIQLYPLPSAAGSLVIFYYKIAAPLTADTDVIDVPEGWDDLVLDYAEYRAFRRDSDERWQTAKAMYDQNLNSMMDTTRRYVEATGMIVDSSFYLPEWLYAP